MNTRGGSSCNYNVLINVIEVPITADSGPSFKNTLSAGDRNTLALAFFFASLDQDQNLMNKIVIIDDPMTSLDEYRSLATIHEMNDLANRVEQVIVMSHSKPFLCQLWDGADKINRTALKITRKGQSSTIGIWDVTQDCITEHDKRHQLIQQYVTENDSLREREVATALRYVLETFLRVAYPIHFPPGTLLGHFHNKCTQALRSGNPILNDTDTTELRRLMDYAYILFILIQIKCTPKCTLGATFWRNPLILLCRCAESNRRPSDYESTALPTELQRHSIKVY